ncbi:MAG TPA: hypothetical protein VHW09_27085 [Bryobacteraceae bacterium]|jgi:hypothetical protein|nr:hypothetical protein [Bryobacteraceae bacterium]
MKDLLSDFWTGFDECAAEVRAERIRHERVVSLRHDVTVEQRKTIALQSLERAVMQLEILGDDIADADLMERLDAIDAKLARRRFALRMRLGLVHLTGIFGRRAP